MTKVKIYSFVVVTITLASGGPLGAAIVSRDIDTYVLFAYQQLLFKGGSSATDSGHIVGGNIGVNYPGLSPTGFSLGFATNGQADMADGYQAVADSVRTNLATGSYYDLFANSLNTSFAGTIRNEGPLAFTTPIIATVDLPTLPFTPGRASTNTASNLTLSDTGNPHTLAPGTWRDVRLNDNVVLNLDDGVYDMRDLSVGKNVTFNVTDNTVLQIDSTFNPNDNMKFGMNAEHHGGAHVYVGGMKLLSGDNGYGGLLNIDTEQVTNFAHNGADRSEQIHMQYFAPNSWLDLGGDNELYGRYWAGRITGDPDNNVYYEVPEPTMLLFLGLGGFSLLRKRRA